MLFLHTLGTARIDAGGRRLTPTSARKFALLLHLSSEPGRRVSRDVLRDLIFPGISEDNAKHSLRELVFRLRRIGVRIDADKHGLALDSAAVVSDYRELLSGERPDPAQLTAAAGGFLPGYAPDHSEAYSEWLEGFRASATFEICKALLKELARAKRAGDWPQAERAARACLALDPLNEEATLGLAEMLAIGGAKVAAVRLLDRYIREVDGGPADLKVPASILRRRISEHIGPRYHAPTVLPFVGRDEEMAMLADGIQRAREGEPHCIVLVGEPGIGKTRLADEACTRAVLDGFRVERVATQPNDRDRPFAAFLELVPRLRELPGALGASPSSLDALDRLITHKGPSHVSSEPDLLRSQITRGIDDLVEAIASEAPLLLFIDDAQWLDDVSISILSGLSAARRRRRICVLFASRDNAASRLPMARAERAITIKVPPLTFKKCETLVECATPLTGLLNAGRRRWIASTSAGNPLFLQELITHGASTEQAHSIPRTISALLDQSLLTISEPARIILTVCASLGRHSTLDRLLRVLQLPHIELLSAIGELESGNFIAQTETRVAPRHALIAEAALRYSTPIVMRAQHARIAEVLRIEVLTTHESALYWACAEHLLAAGDVARAIDLLNECVQHAVEIGRPREAAELLIRAAAQSDAPLREKLATDAVRIALAATEADVLLRALELIDPAKRLHQHNELELAALYATDVCDMPADRLARFTHCVMDDGVSDEHRIAAGWMLLIVADYQRRPDIALKVFEQLDGLLAAAASRGEIRALLFYLVFHSCYGDVDAAALIADQLIAAAKATTAATTADLYRKAAIGYWRAGHSAKTIDALRTAYELAVEAGVVRVQLASSLMLAGFLQDIGDDEGSVAWAERAEHLSDDYPGTRITLDFATLMSEMALGRGDSQEIAVYASRMRALSSGHATSRAVRWTVVLEYASMVRRGDEFDIDFAVDALTRNLTGKCDRGDTTDGEVAMAAQILFRGGRRGAATSLLASYFSEYRSGRAPLSRFLREVMKEIGFVDLSSTE